MRMSRRPLAARCQEIRERLRDFAADRLGPTATGEVQGHLLSCQDCSEVFGELLMEEIENDAAPLLTPPRIPPIEWYDAYMRAGSSRFGTFWKSVRDALQASDGELRRWALATRDEIAQTIEGLVRPDPFPSAVRTRGAVRVRGARPTRGPEFRRTDPRPDIAAEVVSPDGSATGDFVRFTVDEPPRITPDNRFCLSLSTADDAHDGDVVICTVGRPGGPAVSFSGTITHRAGQQRRDVRIDEPGVPGRARTIPLDRVSLAAIPS